MDLDILQDFLSVLEHGSILAAAEATGTSQPRLSRRMRELEDTLGVLLFNRSSRGVTPTVYGTLFQQHAEKLLRNHQSAIDDIRALKHGTHGHARIGMAPAFSGYLPTVIKALRVEKVGATFDVVDGTYDSLVLKTLKGEIDGAFTMLPPGESVESLAVNCIGIEPLLIVARQGHHLNDQPQVAVEQLGKESWILMNRPRSILNAFQELANSMGLSAPNVAIETSSLDFLKSVIRDSELLTVLPAGAVHADLARGSLTQIPMQGLPSVEIGFIHRHGVLPPLVTQLVHEVERFVGAFSA